MIIRDPLELNVETRQLWDKQEGLIIVYNLPFRLFETRRTPERQKELYDQGVSMTLNSKHITGDAWDVALWKKGGWSWEDEWWFEILGTLTKNLIADVSWGGNWKNFRDLGHYQREGA